MSVFDRAQVGATPDGRLTRAGAARFLGVAEKTLANWLCQGKGPRALRVGGRVFYAVEDLTSFIRVAKE